jgi:hypothetical protein
LLAELLEIAQDRIGLPDGGVAVDESRHLAIGVECEIGGILRVVELAAVILALVGLAHLLQQPDHLLHIPRGLAPQHSQHALLLPYSLHSLAAAWPSH